MGRDWKLKVRKIKEVDILEGKRKKKYFIMKEILIILNILLKLW